MQAHQARARSFHQLWKRAKKDQSGATIIEFAMIFPVFLAIIFGIFEASLIFLKQMLLDNAVQAAAREIMVGKTQAAITAGNAAAVEEAFRKRVCDDSFFFKSKDKCDTLKFQVLIDTAEINAERDARRPINMTTKPPTITINAAHSFTPLPTRNVDAVVRVYAPTQTLLARMNGIALNMENGWSVLVSGTAFRVEPFPSAAPPTP